MPVFGVHVIVHLMAGFLSFRLFFVSDRLSCFCLLPPFKHFFFELQHHYSSTFFFSFLFGLCKCYVHSQKLVEQIIRPLCYCFLCVLGEEKTSGTVTSQRAVQDTFCVQREYFRKSHPSKRLVEVTAYSLVSSQCLFHAN